MYNTAVKVQRKNTSSLEAQALIRKRTVLQAGRGTKGKNVQKEQRIKEQIIFHTDIKFPVRVSDYFEILH